MIRIVLICGLTFLSAGLITPDPFLAGFLYWVGVSLLMSCGWAVFFNRKKSKIVKHPSDQSYTLMVNDAEHWEKPHWIVASSGPLDASMITMLVCGEYIAEKGDMKIIRTEYVKEFLEANNEDI